MIPKLVTFGRLDFAPLEDRVLVRRLPDTERTIEFTDPPTGMVIVEGVVLAVGPGCYDEDGDFHPTTVKPGQRVMFNARWNDFTGGELVGSDCDAKGPLERPMPQWQYASGQKDLHLITEGDIAGILA